MYVHYLEQEHLTGKNSVVDPHLISMQMRIRIQGFDDQKLLNFLVKKILFLSNTG